MNHPEAVNAIQRLSRQFASDGVEDTLIKYARANDLSPAQLARLGHTYNTMSALATYEKSPDRGATAHNVDVEQIIGRYAGTDMRKSASTIDAPVAPPVETHNAETVDLKKMLAAIIASKEQEQKEEELEEPKEDEAKEEANEEADDIPDLETLEEAATDVDRDIDVQASELLRGMDKSAGFIRLAEAEDDALQMVKAHFVDAALYRVAQHAAGLPIPVKVRRRQRDLPIEKRAFAVTCPAGKKLADIALNFALLDRINRMIKAATIFGDKEGNITLDDEPPTKPRKPDKQERELSDPSRFQEDEDDTSTPSEPPAKPKEDIFERADSAGGEETMESVPRPAETQEASDADPGEGSQTGEGEETEEGGTRPRPRRANHETNRNEERRNDTAPRERQRPDDKTHSASVLGSFADEDLGTKIKDMLSAGAAIPLDAGKGMLDGVSHLAQKGLAYRDSLVDKPRQDKSQMAADMSVDDIRRSMMLRRIIHTDRVLSESDPAKVVKYYNLLAAANPQLAADPDAIKLVLREAVAYDGLPTETIKNLTSTRLDHARAISEEVKNREHLYKI